MNTPKMWIILTLVFVVSPLVVTYVTSPACIQYFVPDAYLVYDIPKREVSGIQRHGDNLVIIVSDEISKDLNVKQHTSRSGVYITVGKEYIGLLVGRQFENHRVLFIKPMSYMEARYHACVFDAK